MDSNLLERAERYFSGHPQNAFWLDADAPRKQRVLEMAGDDIAVFLAGRPVRDDGGLRETAQFDQALFLLSPAADIAGDGVLSESIEGVGSRTYRSGAADGSGLAPRARRLLESLICGSAGRLSRG